MAYMDQDRKAPIAAAIKALNLPKSWRISLRVRHHSTLVISIARAPATVLDDYIPTPFQLERNPEFVPTADKLYINEHNIANTFRGPTLKVLESVMAAVKSAGNWFDKSDSQSDYFHVAFWIDMKFGTMDKEVELVGNRRSKSETVRAFAEEQGIPVIDVKTVETDAGDMLGMSMVLDAPADDKVVPLFRNGLSEPQIFQPVPLHDFSLAEKQAIARAELIRRYKVAFAATPVGASLNEYAVSVLAEAALQVIVD